MKTRRIFGLFVGVAMGLCAAAGTGWAEEQGNEHPWYVSAGPGWADFEGDFVTKDAFLGAGQVGYTMNEWWSFEGTLWLAPYLRGQTYVDYSSGTPTEVNRLEQEAGKSSTWLMGVSAEALLHFTPWKRVDPYLALGVGALRFGDSFSNHDQWDANVRGGLGIMYHFNDEWAVRGDYRGVFAGIADKGTVNALWTAGVCWTPGAHLPPNYTVSGGPKDSDADGLTDAEEAVYHTDPNNPDTDGDGLSDFDEVKKYHTDPLNPDTDYDGLMDGPEVFTYRTNPLDPDTDKGGVRDGHEVIEDHTNPLDPKDDLQLFTLDIKFDLDMAVIKPDYFKDLAVIGKVLQRDPGATARIEGHADKLKNSSKEHNELLSQRRAEAVLDYIAKEAGIDKSRMVAKGYGFSRPLEPNDKVNGNPKNRRVEVYIRKSDQQAPVKITDTPQKVDGVKEPAEPPTK